MRITLLLPTIVISLIPLLSSAKNEARLKLPKQEMGFIENIGQVNDQYSKPRTDIQFALRSSGLNVFIGNGELHYQFSNHDFHDLKDYRDTKSIGLTKMYRLDMELVNANKNATVIKEDKQEEYNTYHLPGINNEVANTYKKITYRNIYPNIDWVLYIKNGMLEYEFEVKKGGDPAVIKLKYAGASSMALNEDGSVNIVTPMGTVKEHTPYTYTPGGEVKSSFKLEETEISFDLANNKGALTIDPVLTWGTYYGGSSDDYSEGVTLDASGNIYMCGYTASTNNIATVGSQQATIGGGYDGFIAKFNSAGVRQWATYYGGTNDDYLFSVACDQQGNVFASGRTLSASGIATPTAHQTTMYGISDAFLLKLSDVGQLQWCTYYGGFSNEFGYAVACDGNNNVYLCGATSSGNNIATTGTHQAFQFGGYQAFLVKFDNAGARQWGTYFGGTSDDYGYGMCIDGGNNIYICGRATSSDYISSAGAYQTTFAGGANDGFLAKFNSADGTTSWSTYYGDAGDDQAFALACNGTSVYLAGQTDGTATIATALSHQDTYGGGAADAFLVKFDNTGARQWATYYGGSADDYAKGLNCDGSGNIYMTGYTNSSGNIASASTYQATPGGGQDAFLVKFTSAGTRDWGTYYGGTGDDYGYSVTSVLDAIYVCGYTGSSAAIATNAAHQTALSSDPDGFLAKFGDCTVAPVQPGTITGLSSVCEGSSQNYFITPIAGASSYTWTLPSGWTGTSTANSILTTVGNASGSITVTANNGCGTSPARSFSVTVATPNATITQVGNQLSTGTFTSYQWYRNAALISGATSQIYTATQNGDYYVHVTNASGCAANSDTVTVTGVYVSNVKTNTSFDVMISPNPNNGVFTLLGNTSARENIFITVNDVTGRIILSGAFTAQNGKINQVLKLDDNTAAGVYILKITAGNNNTVLQLVKQ